MYKLRYLPLAQKDLESITDYMTDNLKAPKAALDFLDAIEEGFEQICAHPYSCRVYQPIKPTELEYRALTVKNYIVFYVVIDNIIEVHRIVYGRRNLPQIIK